MPVPSYEDAVNLLVPEKPRYLVRAAAMPSREICSLSGRTAAGMECDVTTPQGPDRFASRILMTARNRHDPSFGVR
jgi:hypothetical protein